MYRFISIDMPLVKSRTEIATPRAYLGAGLPIRIAVATVDRFSIGWPYTSGAVRTLEPLRGLDVDAKVIDSGARSNLLGRTSHNANHVFVSFEPLPVTEA